MEREYQTKEEISTLYFDYPTQVVFEWGFETIPDRRLGGIAYGNEIICGECGGIIGIHECIYIKVLKWIDISDAIKGE